MTNKITEVVMLDKKFLVKKMDLPGLAGVKGEVAGVPGTEEEVPGVPGVEKAEDEDDEECKYCSECGGKLSHKEPEDDDSEEPDDDLDDINEKQIPKKVQSFIKKVTQAAKRMFAGATPLMGSQIYQEIDGVAVIHISGEIGKRLSMQDKMEGKVDVDDITEACKIAMSSNVKAAILWVNSPGGSSTGVQECGEVIQKLASKIPTFAFTDTIAASAAYWLCACTNGMFVTPSSEIGSIGVYAKVLDMSEALAAQGINVQIFQAGSLKTMGQPEVTLSDEEAKLIQDDINEQWVKFKTLVSESRGGVSEDVMQGQLFSGEKAVAVNLADQVVPDFEAVLELIGRE